MGPVALGLSMAALPARISYRTGKFVSGNWRGLNYPFDVSIVGADNTISVDTGILCLSHCSSENPEVIYFSFSNGTVTVKNPAGRTVFSDGLRDGLIVWKSGSVDFEITAGLLPKPGVAGGSLDFTAFSKHGALGALSGPGHGSVFVTTIDGSPGNSETNPC